MSGDQILQMLQIISALVVTIVTSKVGAALKTKVDVAIYSAKVKELHDEINGLRVRVAVLEAQRVHD